MVIFTRHFTNTNKLHPVSITLRDLFGFCFMKTATLVQLSLRTLRKLDFGNWRQTICNFATGFSFEVFRFNLDVFTMYKHWPSCVLREKIKLGVKVMYKMTDMINKDKISPSSTELFSFLRWKLYNTGVSKLFQGLRTSMTLEFTFNFDSVIHMISRFLRRLDPS